VTASEAMRQEGSPWHMLLLATQLVGVANHAHAAVGNTSGGDPHCMHVPTFLCRKVAAVSQSLQHY